MQTSNYTVVGEDKAKEKKKIDAATNHRLFAILLDVVQCILVTSFVATGTSGSHEIHAPVTVTFAVPNGGGFVDEGKLGTVSLHWLPSAVLALSLIDLASYVVWDSDTYWEYVRKGDGWIHWCEAAFSSALIHVGVAVACGVTTIPEVVGVALLAALTASPLSTAECLNATLQHPLRAWSMFWQWLVGTSGAWTIIGIAFHRTRHNVSHITLALFSVMLVMHVAMAWNVVMFMWKKAPANADDAAMYEKVKVWTRSATKAAFVWLVFGLTL